jgi:hypothetical protein
VTSATGGGFREAEATMSFTRQGALSDPLRPAVR